MDKFEFSTAFLIGQEKIDSDHIDLIAILNEMVDGFMQGDTHLCQNKWQEFYTKLEKHFVDETEIMINYGYIDDDVDDDHEKVLDHIINLGNKENSLENWEFCLYEMRNYLLSWILKKDLLFAEHLVTIGYNKT